ncbi:MAG: tryptophan--tRNA ligase [Armatimonadota bacterium]|nr:MAG: tryptophan--tRNA ligase [Armatimonadota bacterium]
MKKGVIFSGMRPTGPVHLGNLEGALRSWVTLQDEYELYCGIVDLHALTTDHEDTSELAARVRQMAVDFISAGIDPELSTILVQSHVREHAELHLLLSMITPVGWLERVPTYKEKVDDLHGAAPGYGLLGYPVLMASDILLYRSDTVPVGQDQLPHLELTREIARRFNYLYGEVFSEPAAKVTKHAVLPGLDGRKMSKSYDNLIYIAEDPESIRAKVKGMFTDPSRAYRTDPGHPDICPVFTYHSIYTATDVTREIEQECKGAQIGCVECKEKLAQSIIAALAPIRERRQEIEARPGLVDEILHEGAERARRVARSTMALVREAMKLPQEKTTARE